MKVVDYLVVGAGMAGASIAAELSDYGSVVMIERENQPGYHSTGRSAAVFSETYGPPTIQALSSASRAFFENPPEGFRDHPLLTPRGMIMIARADQADRLDEFLADNQGTARGLDTPEMCRMVPILRGDQLAGGAFEPDCSDIDVAALHQGFLRLVRERGGRVVTDMALPPIERDGGRWQVDIQNERIAVGAIVNSSGAWGDEVARSCGAGPIGLVPKRRTAITIDVPPACDASAWPVVVDIDERFYFKPESGRLLISPADTTPSPPTDAQPEEIDVATAVDRFETATDLAVKKISHRWAGLRTFAPDGDPVVGWDPDVDAFFWLVGQGGYGIQTAPAMARLAAALAVGAELSQDIVDKGVDASSLSPRRFKGKVVG
ncbi:MAG: FAD-binding oxidoreductase [Pseudomonadota bacterium]